MTTSKHPVLRGRTAAGYLTAVGASLMLALSAPGSALADSIDGNFPTADEVGGEVYPDGIEVGEQFPTDWEIYDSSGKEADIGALMKNKRTILAFFISAVPVSVDELKKLQVAYEDSPAGDNTQMLFVNTDQVGGKLQGVDPIQETARTVRTIKREEGITHPLYVAPNDALSPDGLSNRLGFRGLPTVYVIDANGKVEKIYAGPQDWHDTQI